MKLNYKRTILVGFAFFLISAFWQAYDATIPVILTNKFGMSQNALIRKNAKPTRIVRL